MGHFEDSRGMPTTVLILGGWSPGPLTALKSRFRAQCSFLEPAIPMPPVGVGWCASPSFMMLVAELVLVPWLCVWVEDEAGISSAGAALATLGVISAAAVLARLCVAGLVRDSLRVGAQRAAATLRQHPVDVVVGFSWGGGVAADLLREGHLGVHGSPSVLLLAPTTAAIARCALQRDAASAIRIDAANRGRVYVFHASHDGFCPDAQRECWEATGATTHTCHDSHVFERQCSLDEISRALQTLCDIPVRSVPSVSEGNFIGSDNPSQCRVKR
jgi:hypothetical protein